MGDDLEKIPDDSFVLRRISPIQVRPDPTTGKRRLTSAAFTDPRMSVDSEAMLIADGKDWQFSLRRWPDAFLVKLSAKLAREKGQIIEPQPNPPEQPNNHYHCEVVGPKSGSVRNALRDAAVWLKKPADVD